MLTDKTFIPGSRWLYIKIYGSQTVCDGLLSDTIPAFANRLRREGVIDKWFFIRYSDPDFHLRLRLSIADKGRLGDVMARFSRKMEPFVREGLVHRLSIDTYVRKSERYGERIMEETETLFWRDSERICRIIKLVRRAGNENLRWEAAFKMVDSLLDEMGFTLERKQDFTAGMAANYHREFGFDSHNSKQLNTMYRERQKLVRDIMEGSALPRKVEEEAHAPLTGFGAVDKKLALPSCIHMMINRLFPTKNRLHEMVIYDFINRYYKSAIARGKATIS